MNSSEYQEVEEEPPNDTPYQETLRDIIFWIARNSNAFIEHTTVGINLFHLFILFQKPLRSSSIFILMIGICLSDILAFTVIFYYLGVDRNNYQYMVKKLRRIDKYVSCLEDVNEFVDPFGMLIAFILNATRPISIWLAILMALIRSLSIIFPMSNRIHKMTKPSNAILMVVTVCSFWILYYSWDIVLIEYWYVPSHIILEGCPVKVSALRNRIYILVISSPLYSLVDYRHTYEYLVRLIPAVFYPFLTVSLLIELWRIRKKRANMKMEKSDNTTILIFFMTISFMLSEGLEGLSGLDISHWWESYESFVSQIEVFNNLRSINAFSHFFVCFLMSSQYRDCVKQLFCFWRPKTKTVKVKSAEHTISQTFQTINSKTK